MRLLFLLLVFLPYNLTGQIVQEGINHGYSIDLHSHYGFLMPHRPVVDILNRGSFPVHEISLTKKTSGVKQWQKIYHQPSIGISYLYTAMNRSPYNGPAHMVFYHLDLPFLKTPRSRIILRQGYGLCYSSKPFHRVTNYKNLTIGSHINIAIAARLYYEYDFSKKISIKTGFSLQHYSNGGYKKPNLGINIASIMGGLTYNIIDLRKDTSLFIRPSFIPEINHYITVSEAIKEIYPAGGSKYFVTTLQYQIIKQQTLKINYGGGIDFIYDPSGYDVVKRTDPEPLNVVKYRAGCHLTGELKIDKFTLHGQSGVYLFTKDKTDGLFYQRAGVRYFILKHLFIHLSLKTHFAKADYLECGTGLKF